MKKLEIFFLMRILTIIGFRIELICSLFDKKILSLLYPDIFFNMLNHISKKRPELIDKQEKISVLPSIINELTSKQKYTFESKLKRKS